MMIEDKFCTIDRREFLAASTGIASSILFPARESSAEDHDATEFQIVDTNVSLFQWPFRRLPLDDSAALVQKFQTLGITQAWAGSFEGVLQRDLAGVNSRLAEECRKHQMFVPIGSVNPTLPGWKDDLRRCFVEHNMVGIRLHPNYHGYTLETPEFTRLIEDVTESGRFVQIAVAMEDRRTQHAKLQLPDVDLSPLVTVLKQIPHARVQLLNYWPRAPLLNQLADLPGISFDTARVEGTDGVPRLVEAVNSARVMFGSHAPFLIPEAALIRTHESGLLDQQSLRAVLSGNAGELLRGNKS